MIIKDYRKIERLVNALNKLANDSEKFKFVKVGKAKWANINTKRVQTVDKVYFFAKPSCSRPIIIDEIHVIDKDTNCGDTYYITDYFYHVNIYDGYDDYSIEVHGNGKLIPKNCKVLIKGQEFCNPITMNHIYEGNDRDMANLLRVTLMSQNTDDGYGTNPSVNNGYLDETVTSSCCRLTPDVNSPIELLLGKTSHDIRELDPIEFNRLLRDLADTPPDYLWAKQKSLSYYQLILKSEYEANKDQYSTYYPVFTHEMIKRMKIEVPRDMYDIGVYGLGSAGTAILDQLARSNWLKTIYLCDFDIVEDKNLINQWYYNTQISLSKASACENLLKKLERGIGDGVSFYIKKDTAQFQDTDLSIKEFKYVVSGFDSLQVRQEFFDKIQDKTIEARYLIDCRYLDLACSIYFIDLENPEEVEFYKANLEADAELMRQAKLKEIMTFDEFVEWVDRKGYFNSNCFNLKYRLLNVPRGDSGICPCKVSGESDFCKDDGCKKFLYDAYVKSLPNDKISKNDASCVKYNYIDIYKYVGAIIFGAVRNIEHGIKKPFTLCEAQTDVHGLPNYMIVKE